MTFSKFDRNKDKRSASNKGEAIVKSYAIATRNPGPGVKMDAISSNVLGLPVTARIDWSNDEITEW